MNIFLKIILFILLALGLYTNNTTFGLGIKTLLKSKDNSVKDLNFENLKKNKIKKNILRKETLNESYINSYKNAASYKGLNDLWKQVSSHKKIKILIKTRDKELSRNCTQEERKILEARLLKNEYKDNIDLLLFFTLENIWKNTFYNLQEIILENIKNYVTTNKASMDKQKLYYIIDCLDNDYIYKYLMEKEEASLRKFILEQRIGNNNIIKQIFSKDHDLKPNDIKEIGKIFFSLEIYQQVFILKALDKKITKSKNFNINRIIANDFFKQIFNNLKENNLDNNVLKLFFIKFKKWFVSLKNITDQLDIANKSVEIYFKNDTFNQVILFWSSDSVWSTINKSNKKKIINKIDNMFFGENNIFIKKILYNSLSNKIIWNDLLKNWEEKVEKEEKINKVFQNIFELLKSGNTRISYRKSQYLYEFKTTLNKQNKFYITDKISILKFLNLMLNASPDKTDIMDNRTLNHIFSFLKHEDAFLVNSALAVLLNKRIYLKIIEYRKKELLIHISKALRSSSYNFINTLINSNTVESFYVYMNKDKLFKLLDKNGKLTESNRSNIKKKLLQYKPKIINTVRKKDKKKKNKSHKNNQKASWENKELSDENKDIIEQIIKELEKKEKEEEENKKNLKELNKEKYIKWQEKERERKELEKKERIKEQKRKIKNAKKSIDKGKGKYKNKEIKDALELFLNAFKTLKSDKSLIFNIICCYYVLKDFNHVIYYSDLIDDKDKSTSLYKMLGKAYFDIKIKKSNKLEYFDKLEEKYNNSIKYFGMSKNSNAKKNVETEIKKLKEDKETQIKQLISRAKQYHKNYSVALRAIKELGANNIKNNEFYILKGEFLFDNNTYDKAKMYYENILKRNDVNSIVKARIHINLCRFHMEKYPLNYSTNVLKNAENCLSEIEKNQIANETLILKAYAFYYKTQAYINSCDRNNAYCNLLKAYRVLQECVKNKKENNAFRKVCYMLGKNMLDFGCAKNAINCFEHSINNSDNKKEKREKTLWLAKALYSNKNFEKAENTLESLNMEYTKMTSEELCYLIKSIPCTNTKKRKKLFTALTKPTKLSHFINWRINKTKNLSFAIKKEHNIFHHDEKYYDLNAIKKITIKKNKLHIDTTAQKNIYNICFQSISISDKNIFVEYKDEFNDYSTTAYFIIDNKHENKIFTSIQTCPNAKILYEPVYIKPTPKEIEFILTKGLHDIIATWKQEYQTLFFNVLVALKLGQLMLAKELCFKDSKLAQDIFLMIKADLLAKKLKDELKDKIVNLKDELKKELKGTMIKIDNEEQGPVILKGKKLDNFLTMISEKYA